MHYMLSLLLIFGVGFAQKTTIIKKIDDEKKVEVKVNVEDDKVLYSITEDGKTEEYEADINDEDAMAEIHEKLAEHDCDALVIPKTKCDKGKVKIIKKHKMMDDNTGFLGVQIQDLSEQLSEYFKVKDGNGVLVSEVVEDSPAKKAGLKAGDIITKVDDEDIENANDLTMTIRSYEPDSKVSVAIIRDGKKKKLDAILGEAEKNYFPKFSDLGKLDDRHKMLLKMHPEGLEDFEFHSFPFDKEEFQKQMDEMREELSEMKEELKKLLKEN